MSIRSRLHAYRCRRGHDWFPNLGAQEFLPTQDTCMRCGTKRLVRPWGRCLGRHDIAEHYVTGLSAQPTVNCKGPR